MNNSEVVLMQVLTLIIIIISCVYPLILKKINLVDHPKLEIFLISIGIAIPSFLLVILGIIAFRS